MKYQNKEELLEILAHDGMKLKEIEDDMKYDEDVVITSLKSTLSALQYVDEKFSTDKHFIMRAIKETPWALFIYKFADEKIASQEDVVIESVKKDGQVLAFAGKKFNNRKDLAYLALNAKKHAGIEYVGAELKNDAEFMLEVLTTRPEEFHHISPMLKSDIAFLAQAVLANKSVLKFVDKDLVNIIKDYIVEKMQNQNNENQNSSIEIV